MRKNIYPLSPVHAFPAAWSGSVRKLKDTSGLHNATGFWNGKSSQINPARGLQAGILPEKRHFFRRLKEKHEPTCGEWFSAFSRMICHSLEIELHICRKYAKQQRIYRINLQEDALYATVHPFLACQIKRKRCLFELKSSHTVTKRHFMRQKNKRTKRQNDFYGENMFFCAYV